MDNLEKAIELYKQGVSQHELQNKMRLIDSVKLRKELIKRGIEIRPNRQKRYNEHYFDVIDTEEKAYWLGFIYADGHNGTKGLEVTINEKDKSHLEKLSQAFESNLKLSYRPKQRAYRFCINNSHLKNRLNELGVTRNKTFNISFPSFLPKELQRHFIRGYFDGDGCIVQVEGKTRQIIRAELIGTENFLTELMKVVGIECQLLRNKRWKEGTPTRYFSACGEQGIKFLKFMYEDCSIALDRKMEKALAVLERNF